MNYIILAVLLIPALAMVNLIVKKPWKFWKEQK